MSMVNVVGIQMVNYKNKEGKQVNGVRIAYTYAANGYEGVAVGSEYVGGRTYADAVTQGAIPRPGDLIEFTYGKSFNGSAYVNGWKFVDSK